MKGFKRLSGVFMALAIISAVIVLPVSAEEPVTQSIAFTTTTQSSLNMTHVVNGSGGFNTSRLRLRNNGYVVFPVTVSKTAAYRFEIRHKAAESAATKRRIEIRSAYSSEYDSTSAAATGLTSYSLRTGTKLLPTTTAYYDFSKSIVLEAGTTYYFKLAATVSGSSAVDIYSVRFTETGKRLADLTVDGAELVPEFPSETNDYTVYTEMPSDGKVTINATPVEDSATINIDGVNNRSLIADVNYGINDIIPVTVTDSTGTNTYNLKIIVTGFVNVSLNCDAETFYSADTATPTDSSEVFDGDYDGQSNTANTTGKISSTGYIQVDLEEKYKKYSLFQMITYCGSSTSNFEISATGSNDPAFSDGTEQVLGKSSGIEDYIEASKRLQYTRLNADEKYRYMRITAAYTIYPYRIDLIGFEEVNETTSDEITTVTIPSRFYTPGQRIIAAVYDSEHRLVSVDTSLAQDAYTTELNVNRTNPEDSIQVMIWDSFERMHPLVQEIVPIAW